MTPAWRDPERRSLITFFLIAAAAIPVFYLPALFFDGSTHYTIADTWRFWIIHLWVEGFFELFVTVVVAIIFYQLGLVERTTALRVISVMTNATVGTITQAPQGNVIKVNSKGTESEYTVDTFQAAPKGRRELSRAGRKS
ncbi:MAG TPA: hypothetical protein VGH39_10635 [Xanthobacteraceae bacterium]